jgi:hypothetical protein
MTSENLIEIDNERFEQLYNLAKITYPNVADYFLHLICVEQCAIEAGYENKELSDDLYEKAQEQLKKNEYYFNVEKNLSD